MIEALHDDRIASFRIFFCSASCTLRLHRSSFHIANRLLLGRRKRIYPKQGHHSETFSIIAVPLSIASPHHPRATPPPQPRRRRATHAGHTLSCFLFPFLSFVLIILTILKTHCVCGACRRLRPRRSCRPPLSLARLSVRPPIRARPSRFPTMPPLRRRQRTRARALAHAPAAALRAHTLSHAHLCTRVAGSSS